MVPSGEQEWLATPGLDTAACCSPPCESTRGTHTRDTPRTRRPVCIGSLTRVHSFYLAPSPALLLDLSLLFVHLSLSLDSNLANALPRVSDPSFLFAHRHGVVVALAEPVSSESVSPETTSGWKPRVLEDSGGDVWLSNIFGRSTVR